MRTREARIGAALAGSMLFALPLISGLWSARAPSGADAITSLIGMALLVASAAGARRR
jgi:hypothetical protein